MAQKSCFFNSVLDIEGNPDRPYFAEDFAEMFLSFFKNGIFPNPATNLQVVADGSNMIVKINSGTAFINGHHYFNTDFWQFKLDVADGKLDRIDKVVLRLDNLNREILLQLKKGDFNSNPVAPKTDRNDDVYELGLAEIRVNHGTVKLSQSDITDLRLNKTECGIVDATIKTVDTTAIFNQFQSWYDEKKKLYDADINKWIDNKRVEFDNWYKTNTESILNQFKTFYDANTGEFEKWFNDLKEKLKGDVATNLLNEISATKEEVKDNKNQIDALKVSVENTNKKIDGIELTAAKVTIKDDDNLFSSNDVEGALKEVFIKVDNGKKLLRQAIIDKDHKVSVCTNPSFNDLKNSIGKIKTGVVTGDSIKNNKLGLDEYTLTNVLPFPNYFELHGRYYNYQNGSYAISYRSLIRHDSSKDGNAGVTKVFNKYNELLVTRVGRCKVVFLEDNSFLMISISSTCYNGFVYYYNSACQLINECSTYWAFGSESNIQIIFFKDELLLIDIKNSNTAFLYSTKERKLYSNCRNFKNNDYSKISTRRPYYFYKDFYYRFISRGFYQTVIEKYRYDKENKQLSLVSNQELTNINLELSVYGENGSSVVPVQLPSAIVGFKDNMLITVFEECNQIRVNSNIYNDDLDITYTYILRYYNLDTLKEVKTNKITSRYRYQFISEIKNSFIACERADWFIGVSGREYLKENDRSTISGHKIGSLSESLILK